MEPMKAVVEEAGVHKADWGHTLFQSQTGWNF